MNISDISKWKQIALSYSLFQIYVDISLMW